MQPCRYEPWGAESEEFGTPVMFVPLTFFCAKIILINRTEMFTEEVFSESYGTRMGAGDKWQ